MLTGRWQYSPVSSFDQVKSSGCDRTLSEKCPDAGCQSPVNSSKVPERENPDRTRRSVLIFLENYLFGTETNQCFIFGTQKFELSYLAPS